MYLSYANTNVSGNYSKPLYLNDFILKNRLLDFSLLLSAISITLTVIINFQIAKEYLGVDGKTQALFGIKEMLQFSYQYYVVGIGLISASFAFIGKSNRTRKKYIAIILSLIAILLVFTRIWRLFV